MGWELGPFVRHPEPLLGPRPELTFECPVAGRRLAWAAKDVFNPGATTVDGRVALLVRAEDEVGPYSGTSRLGLATSADGLAFELGPEPVLRPERDAWTDLEWPGGCEDPRLVAAPGGGWICTYTAFAGRRPVLCVATSDDLCTWRKHGPAFAGTPYEGRSSKSGSVVSQEVDGRLEACRVGGRYWMYWGEGVVFAATSDDLVRWTPVTWDATGDRTLRYDPGTSGWQVERQPGPPVLRPVLFPRAGRFDSLLVEPGPPAVLAEEGIVLVVNGANHPRRGDPAAPAFAYQPGQVLLDPQDPASPRERPTDPFLRVEPGAERRGQVDHVLFAQGLVPFDGEWWLYLGQADSRVGCARAPRST